MVPMDSWSCKMTGSFASHPVCPALVVNWHYPHYTGCQILCRTVLWMVLLKTEGEGNAVTFIKLGFIKCQQLQYRAFHFLVDLGWVDLDLGSSPGWWAATVATYCPSRVVEHTK